MCLSGDRDPGRLEAGGIRLGLSLRLHRWAIAGIPNDRTTLGARDPGSLGVLPDAITLGRKTLRVKRRRGKREHRQLSFRPALPRRIFRLTSVKLAYRIVDLVEEVTVFTQRGKQKDVGGFFRPKLPNIGLFLCVVGRHEMLALVLGNE